MKEHEKVKVGVIGVGGIASSVHLPSLAEIEQADVVALCDIIEERAVEQARRFSVTRTYTLHKQMLATEELDAVFVLVEPSNLFHIVLDCLDAGLHTFMEKPPGITSFQARSLCRAAESADRILQVGFNRRHIPLVRHVVKLMRELTTISQVEGCFMKHGSGAFDRGGVSSFPCDTIHAVDLVRWIADGSPVRAATVQGQANDIVPNAWNAIVRFDNDVTGVIKANYQVGGRFHTFEIHGPGASAFINLGFGAPDCEAQIITAGEAGGYSMAATGVGRPERQTIDGMELAGGKAFHRYYGFYQEDLHFLECVRDGVQPETNIQDAVRTFEFVDLLTASLV